MKLIMCSYYVYSLTALDHVVTVTGIYRSETDYVFRTLVLEYALQGSFCAVVYIK